MSIDAGVKYRGSLFDHGFQSQASCTALQLMVFATGSKIFGEHGNPWDL